MASTAALQVQVHEAGGLQRRQPGTAFVDLLSAMEALSEAFLVGKSCVFITELRVLHLWVNSSPVMLGCLGNKNLNLSFESCIIVINRHFYLFSGARVRKTAAPVSRGMDIMSDNVLAGWSVLTE